MQDLVITNEMRKALQSKSIHFSYNWNNKLNCKSFSAVRLWYPEKYELLDLFEVSVKESAKQPKVIKGIARLQVINKFLLHKVTPGISFLDANLTVIDFQQLVKTMYKNKGINFKEHQMCFLVFQYLKNDEILALVDNCK